MAEQNCIFTFVQPLQCLPNHANLELIPGKAGNDCCGVNQNCITIKNTINNPSQYSIITTIYHYYNTGLSCSSRFGLGTFGCSFCDSYFCLANDEKLAGS